MARLENHGFFWAHEIYVRNLIAHSCNMSKTSMHQMASEMTLRNNIGRPRLQYTEEDAVKLVSDSFVAATPNIDMVE